MSGERGTTRPGDHAPFDELAVGWALHALEPEDEAAFTRHLPDCARCARTVAETSEVMAAMAGDLPPAEPPATLRARLRAAVERNEQVRPSRPEESSTIDDLDDLDDLDDFDEPSPAPGPVPPDRATGFPLYEPRRGGEPFDPPVWRRLLPSVVVAVTVAVVLGLGTWNVVLSDARNRAQDSAAAQSQVMRSLLRPGRVMMASMADEGGHAVATVVARDGQLQVVTHGLIVNDPRTSVYVVWGKGTGAPVALGTFDVVRPQMDLRTVGSDRTGLDGYPAYAISIERGRQAPREPSELVANGQVTN